MMHVLIVERSEFPPVETSGAPGAVRRFICDGIVTIKPHWLAPFAIFVRLRRVSMIMILQSFLFQTTRLGKPWSEEDCEKETYVPDYHFSSNYTREGCQMECFRKHIEINCGCYLFGKHGNVCLFVCFVLKGLAITETFDLQLICFIRIFGLTRQSINARAQRSGAERTDGQESE